MNIMLWPVKHVIIAELSVPCEENRGETFERKKFRNDNLHMDCWYKGWACQVMHIEFVYRGLIGWTPTWYLTRPEPTRTKAEGGQLSSFSQQKIGLPVGSGPKSEGHIITKSPSFLSLLPCSTPIQLPTPPFPLHQFHAACCMYLLVTR